MAQGEVYMNEVEQAQHTPPPWIYQGAPSLTGISIWADRRLIGEAWPGRKIGDEDNFIPHGEMVANARLIAAAPDGKDFAIEFLDWAENFEAAWEWAARGESTGEPLSADPGWQGLKALAEAFIAKVT